MQQFHDILLKHGGVVIGIKRQHLRHVVAHAPLLFGGGCCRAYRYSLEDLSRVGIDDGQRKILGHLEAEFCFAYSGGTEYYDKGFHFFNSIKHLSEDAAL